MNIWHFNWSLACRQVGVKNSYFDDSWPLTISSTNQIHTEVASLASVNPRQLLISWVLGCWLILNQEVTHWPMEILWNKISSLSSLTVIIWVSPCLPKLAHNDPPTNVHSCLTYHSPCWGTDDWWAAPFGWSNPKVSGNVYDSKQKTSPSAWKPIITAAPIPLLSFIPWFVCGKRSEDPPLLFFLVLASYYFFRRINKASDGALA